MYIHRYSILNLAPQSEILMQHFLSSKQHRPGPPPDLRHAGHFIEEAQGHGSCLLHQGTQGVDGQVTKGQHTLETGGTCGTSIGNL